SDGAHAKDEGLDIVGCGPGNGVARLAEEPWISRDGEGDGDGAAVACNRGRPGWKLHIAHTVDSLEGRNSVGDDGVELGLAVGVDVRRDDDLLARPRLIREHTNVLMKVLSAVRFRGDEVDLGWGDIAARRACGGESGHEQHEPHREGDSW